MDYTILLYGATGFSGRLIAAHAAERAEEDAKDPGGGTPYRVLLGGRDADKVADLADELDMGSRIFSLDDRADVKRNLRDVDVVINAAGPFARTADRLVKGALDAGCSYVDINGEADVYLRLDDYGRYARQRRLILVSSAGHTAAASDMLLNAALRELDGDDQEKELAAVRIALSRILNFSRGSAESLWRSMREQVTVVRESRDGAKRESVLWHEPVGTLERTFDFGKGPAASDLRIASAANLCDTLTARLTVARRGFRTQRIESYVQTGTAARIGYQLGTLLAPVATIPWVRAVAGLQIGLLPDGPTPDEMAREKQLVLLEIEDLANGKLIDWRWETPNAYQFTSQIVVEIARQVAQRTGDARDAAADPDYAVLGNPFGGWMTPAEILDPRKSDLTSVQGYLRGCALSDRIQAAENATAKDAR